MRFPRADFANRDRSIRLYNADCLDVLAKIPAEALDIAITSPPYNIKGGTAKPSGMFRDRPLNIHKPWYSDDMPEPEYWDWINRIVSECRRTCKGLVWINHKVRFSKCKAIHPLEKINQPCYSEIIWDRGGSITFNARKFAPSHEGIWAFGRPHWWDSAANRLLTVWKITPQRGGLPHPCPFPLEVPSRLVAASCPPGGTVIDPCAGLATTAIACIRNGRKFVGIEKNTDYFAAAVERIKGELQNPAPSKT